MNRVRALVDHQVDRPQVEASQGVELSGTNRPRACLPINVGGCGIQDLFSNVRALRGQRSRRPPSLTVAAE